MRLGPRASRLPLLISGRKLKDVSRETAGATAVQDPLKRQQRSPLSMHIFALCYGL